MRIFLGLGAAELADAGIADHLAEDVFQTLRLRRNHVHRQAALVLGHRRVIEVELGTPVEVLEAVDHKSLRDFTRAVATVIIKQHRIAVADRRERLAVRTRDPGWRHEFVALLGVVQRLVVVTLHRDGSTRRGGGGLAGQHEVGLAYPLPAIVTVHRPEAPAHGRNRPDADRTALGIDLLNVTQTAVRRRVAAIGERVDKNLVRRQTVLLGLPQNAVEMLKHPVHAGVAYNAHQMESRTRLRLDAGDRGTPDGVGREPLFREELVQADEFLVDDATRADVLMADLTVAHYAVGETDVEARGAHQRARVLGVQHVIARLVGLGDGVGRVLRGIGTLAPAITDDEEYGLARSAHGK